MADAASIPNHAQDREDRYVAGLRDELASHQQRGNDDRAEQVRAELERLGRHADPEQDDRDRQLADPGPDAAPARRRTTEARPAPEKAVPPGPKRGG